MPKPLKIAVEARGDAISLRGGRKPKPSSTRSRPRCSRDQGPRRQASGDRRHRRFSKLTDEKTGSGLFIELCNELRALGLPPLERPNRHAGNNAGPAVGGNEPDGLSAVAENIIALHLAACDGAYRLMTVLKAP